MFGADDGGDAVPPGQCHRDGHRHHQYYRYISSNGLIVSSSDPLAPFTIPGECETGDFRCGSGECINGKKVLDEKKDCRDGSDEGRPL